MRRTLEQINRFLMRHLGVQLAGRRSLYPWQAIDYNQPKSFLDGEQAIHFDQSRLNELTERYSKFDERVTNTVIWNDVDGKRIDLKEFRSHSAYLWQCPSENFNPLSSVAVYYYLKDRDDGRILGRLKEDGSYGVLTNSIDGRLVSRDLLDSACEIDFLQRHLGVLNVHNLKILDIGSGYGRLGIRMNEVRTEPMKYWCTDAIPFSTLLCETYLRYLRIDSRVESVPIDQIENSVQRCQLAVNINSFPECTIEAIDWWLDLVTRLKIPYFFLVPNAFDNMGSKLVNSSGIEFQRNLEERGFDLLVKEPKYHDPILQDFGISPTHYYLFKSRTAPHQSKVFDYGE